MTTKLGYALMALGIIGVIAGVGLAFVGPIAVAGNCSGPRYDAQDCAASRGLAELGTIVLIAGIAGVALGAGLVVNGENLKVKKATVAAMAAPVTPVAVPQLNAAPPSQLALPPSPAAPPSSTPIASPAAEPPAAAFLAAPPAAIVVPPAPVAPPPKFCSQCGGSLRGPFCGACGHKNW